MSEPQMQNTSEQQQSPTTSGPLKNLERFWMPKLWHGMLFTAWLRLAYRHGFRITPSRWPMAVMITLITASNSLNRAIQNLLYGRKLARTELVEPPIFIVGHWRSGTTWLHELLNLDPRHTAPNTYECFSPCHFLLSEPFMTRWMKFLLPSRRLPDRMPQTWEAPQEDEPALMGLGQPSPYWKLAFPNEPLQAPEYYSLSSLSVEQQEAWGDTFKQFLTEVTFLRPQRIVSKCPLHAYRMEQLAKTFPGCKFVYIVRDPAVVVPSTMHLWRVVRGSQRLQRVQADEPALETEVIETFQEFAEHVAETSSTLSESQFATIRYEDLKASPVDSLRKIYEQLQLGDFSVTEPAIQEYLDQRQSYRTNKYQTDADLQTRISSECREFCEQFDYAQPESCLQPNGVSRGLPH